MKLHRLRLENFAGVDAREIAFRPVGITIVQGPNEAGKSTLLKAIDLLFHALDSSRAKDVQDIQPRGRDVGPSVRLEFTTGPYEVSYRKQWLHGPRTELDARGPRGRESLTGRDAHHRVEAILDETMDRALWDALRVQQGSLSQAATPLTRSASLRQALDASAEGGLGGAQEQALLDRVAEARGLYLTPTGRPKGEFRNAEARLAAAASARDALAAGLADLEQLLQAIPRGETEVAALGQALQGARQTLGETEGRQRQLEARKAEVEARVAQENLAREAHAGAERALAERARLRAAAEEAGKARASVSARRDGLPGIDALQAARDQALLRQQAAEAAAAAAREARRRAQADLDHLSERQQGAALAKRLQDALAAEEALGAHRLTVQRIRVTKAVLGRIESAQEAHDRLRAQEEAELPRLVLHAHAALEVLVGGEPRRLAPGERLTLPVSARLDVDVPQTLRLTAAGGTAAEQFRQKTAAAEQALRAALDEAGAPSLAAARTQLAERQDAEREAGRAAKALEGALAGATVVELRQQVRLAADRGQRHLADRPPDPPLPVAPREAQARRDEAAQAEDAAAAALVRARQQLDAAAAALAQAKTDHALLDRDLERAAQDQAEAERRLAAAREARADAALQAEEGARRADRATAEQARQGAEAAYQALGPEQEAVLLEAHRSAVSGVEGRLSEARSRLDRNRGALEAVQSDGLQEQFDNACAEVEAAARNLRHLRRLADAAALLAGTLESERASALRNYQRPYQSALEGLGRLVFGDGFGVELSDELGIQRRRLDGTTLDFHQLSTGAQEQLAILARLAAARLVSSEGAPVVLDDAFGYSDPERLERIGAALHLVGQGCQVILLTCSPTRYALVGDAVVVSLEGAPAGELAAAAREAAAAGSHRAERPPVPPSVASRTGGGAPPGA